MSNIKFTTPKGVAQYPRISQPDTTGQYADNKYKTKLVVPASEAKPLVEKIAQIVQDEFGKKAASAKVPYKPDDSGNVVFTLKTKFKPAVFDAMKNKVPDSVNVGPGSLIRCAGVFFVYDKGVSMQLQQVQVLRLEDSAACAFDEDEEGYAFDGEDSNATVATDGEDDLDI